jgi:polyisoprenyl-phosphate glycosyltransferase
MTDLYLSIVIPVYNSEKSIGTMVENLERHYAGQFAFEIVLIDDGSKDQSGRVIGGLSRRYPNVKALYLSRNFGQHSALLAGMGHASGEIVVTMDDDLQHPVDEVAKLIDCMEEGGYDIVYSQYLSKHHTFLKNVGSELNNLMANLIIKKPEDIRFTSFRAIRSYVVREIVKYKAPYPYIDGLLLRVTRNIGKVDIRHDERKSGSSNYTFKKLAGLWMNGFLNFSIMPLRLFSYAGIAIATIGFIFAVFILIQTVFLFTPLPGWTSLMVTMLIFSGVQLLSIGMVGEYVGRVFLTQNGTPQYVIREPGSGRRVRPPVPAAPGHLQYEPELQPVCRAPK